jgi:hypothetical protein
VEHIHSDKGNWGFYPGSTVSSKQKKEKKKKKKRNYDHEVPPERKLFIKNE